MLGAPFRVIKYCLLAGRYDFVFEALPDSLKLCRARE